MDLMSSNSFSMMIVGIVMVVFISNLNRAFAGVVVAKLPFTPPGFFSNMFQYGLVSPQPNDISMTFIYLLTNFSIGVYIKRALGFGGKQVDLQQAGFLPTV